MAADFLVICGLSGAGRSQAAANLDDLGWFVIDNLPAPLIPKVGELAAGPGDGFGHVVTIPLKDVVPGRYVLKIEARSSAGAAAPAVRELEFTVR